MRRAAAQGTCMKWGILGKLIDNDAQAPTALMAGRPMANKNRVQKQCLSESCNART